MRKTSMLIALMITIIGQGMVSPNYPGSQGKVMARRAAIVDVYRQAGTSQGIRILSESFDGKIYTVQAVR